MRNRATRLAAAAMLALLALPVSATTAAADGPLPLRPGPPICCG